MTRSIPVVAGLVFVILGLLTYVRAIEVSALMKRGMSEFMGGAATPAMARVLGLAWGAFGVVFVIVSLAAPWGS